MTMIVRAHGRFQQVLVYGMVLSLAALAWGATLILNGSTLATSLNHTAVLTLFLVGWTVMTAAMMLPTALPMVTTYAQLARARPQPNAKVLLFVLGYLVAWIGFGILAYAADLFVHRAVDASPILASNTNWIGGSVLVLAGLYQVSPLKRRCLQQCRSTLSFLMAHWRDGRQGAWQMGAHHGMFCIGCCWALMLVMFGLGMLQLAWMFGLAALMFVEKTVRGGERIGRLTAPVLVLAGVLVAAGVGSWS